MRSPGPTGALSIAITSSRGTPGCGGQHGHLLDPGGLARVYRGPSPAQNPVLAPARAADLRTLEIDWQPWPG
jgi:hypothetical protein